MTSTKDRRSSALWARIVVWLLSLFVLLAATLPYELRAAALGSANTELTIAPGQNEKAVLPKLERDQRLRADLAVSDGGSLAKAGLLVGRAWTYPESTEAKAEWPATRQKPLKHPAARPAAPRAPPSLL